MADDSDVKEWKAQLKELREDLDELEGKVEVEMTEDEEKAKMEEDTQNLSQ